MPYGWHIVGKGKGSRGIGCLYPTPLHISKGKETPFLCLYSSLRGMMDCCFHGPPVEKQYSIANATLEPTSDLSAALRGGR